MSYDTWFRIAQKCSNRGLDKICKASGIMAQQVQEYNLWARLCTKKHSLQLVVDNGDLQKSISDSLECRQTPISAVHGKSSVPYMTVTLLIKRLQNEKMVGAVKMSANTYFLLFANQQTLAMTKKIYINGTLATEHPLPDTWRYDLICGRYIVTKYQDGIKVLDWTSGELAHRLSTAASNIETGNDLVAVKKCSSGLIIVTAQHAHRSFYSVYICTNMGAAILLTRVNKRVMNCYVVEDDIKMKVFTTLETTQTLFAKPNMMENPIGFHLMETIVCKLDFSYHTVIRNIPGAFDSKLPISFTASMESAKIWYYTKGGTKTMVSIIGGNTLSDPRDDVPRSASFSQRCRVFFIHGACVTLNIANFMEVRSVNRCFKISSVPTPPTGEIIESVEMDTGIAFRHSTAMAYITLIYFVPSPDITDPKIFMNTFHQ